MHDETTTEGPHEEPTPEPTPKGGVTEARARVTRARARTSGRARRGASEATSPDRTTDDAPAEAVGATGEQIGPLEALEVRMGAIGMSEARDVAVTYGAVGMARATDVSVEFGALGLAIGDEVRVSQAFASSVIGGTVDVEQSVSRVVMGGRVTFRRASAALVVLAGRVEGDVRTLLDWRGALAFGAAAGLMIGLLRRR